MKIIIVGDGVVSVALAGRLVEEGHNVALIGEDPERLKGIKNVFDINTIVGRGSHPEVLRQANAEDADMFIALTAIDEINIIACRVAHTIFSVPKKIALVRTRAYLEERDKLFGAGIIPIDVLLNTDKIISHQIKALIKHPGALQIVEFSRARFILACVVAREGGRLVNVPISEFTGISNEIFRIIALYRDSKLIIPTAETQIKAGDEVFFCTPYNSLDQIISGLGKKIDPFKRVIIAGGGEVGSHLAEMLQGEYYVKIIECDVNKAELLAGRFDNVVVLHGDGTDENLLEEENIQHTDIFCALTNDEEDNVLSALTAKHLGARKVLALVNRNSYIDLIRKDRIDIDIALSAQQIALSQLLHHIRRGDAVSAYSLRGGGVEALEMVAHGDAKSSRIVGRKVGDLDLPNGCLICGIIRNDQPIPVDSQCIIEPDDHVIFFVSDKKHIVAIEKLFQVGATFL